VLKDKFRILDIAFDSEKHGDVIDPYEWNQNFKKTEEVFNENLKTLREVTASDIPIVVNGAEGDVQSTIDNVTSRLDENDQTDQEKFNEIDAKLDEHSAAFDKYDAAFVEAAQILNQHSSHIEQLSEKNETQQSDIDELQNKVELLEQAQGEGEVDLSGLVRYDRAQTLTEEQKVQFRTNIGAASSEHTHEGMVTTDQMNTAISEATNGLASTNDVSDAVSGLASTSYVDEAISSAIGDSTAALNEMDGVIG